MIKAYETKPILVEALQYTGENQAEVYQFVPKHLRSEEEDGMSVSTIQNNKKAYKDYFIVKYENGEFDVFSPEEMDKKFNEMPVPEEEINHG